jgi:hypothetical protein
MPANTAQIDAALAPLLRAALRGAAPPEPLTAGAQALFLESTRRHDIQPVICQRLADTGQLAAWPTAVQRQLKDELFGQTALKLSRAGELRRVLAALARRQVFPLLMKGAALSFTHYPTPALRPHTDADLLLEENDLETARQALKPLGYEPANAVSGELFSYQSVFLRSAAPGQSWPLDVHWRLSNRHLFAHSFSFAELSRDARAVPQLGPRARMLGPLHALFLACIHPLAHHQEDDDRLIWLYDARLLAAALSTEEATEFCRLAAAKRAQAACLQTLQRAQEWFPHDCLAALLERLGATATRDPSADYLRPRNWVEDLWLDLRELPLRGKLRLLKEHAFPPADYMLRRYHAPGRIYLPWLYLRRAWAGLRRLGPFGHNAGDE